MSPLLSGEGVSYQASSGRLLVDGVSLSLSAGRLIGLVGPNGAGKSTLLRLLSGLLPGGTGQVLLGPSPLATLSPEQVARRLARVPQTVPAALDFTALEVVLMGRYAHRTSWLETSEDRALAMAALAQVGAASFAAQLFSTLSGGERQRVLIARALAQEPAVLLLDEPTASLDLRHQLEVLETVSSLVASSGLAALAALHDLSLAARYCDELLLLSSGRAVAFGPPLSVLTPERLREVYGVEAWVEQHPRLGHPLIVVEGVVR